MSPASAAAAAAAASQNQAQEESDPLDSALALTIMLAAVTSIGPFALQVIAPGLPTFARTLGVPNDAAQLLITLAIFSMAAGSIVYGPLADRFGRRPVLLSALALAVVGSFIAATAPSYTLILIGRVLQSFGTGAGMVLARAAARDLYGVHGAAAMIARITGFMVLAPMVAPTIGGLVISYIGWRGVFAAIGLFALVLLLWCRRSFKETLVRPSERLDLASVFGDYRRIIGKRQFVAYCSYAALSISTFFLFVGAAPYVMEQSYGLSPAQYGLMFMLVSITFMSCNFLSAWMASRFGSENVVLFAPVFAVGWALAVAALLWFEVGGHGVFGALLAVLSCVGNAVSAGLATPQAVAGAVNAAPERAGSASGLVSVLQFFLAGCAAQAATMLPADQPWTLPVAMAAAAALSSIGFWLMGSGRE